MSQSNVMAFFLIAGFVVFVTIRGELTDYLGVIGLGNVIIKSPQPAQVPNVVSNTYSENPPQPASSSSSGAGGIIGGIIGGIGSLFGL